LALTLGNLTGLLDKIRPAVEATTYTGDRTTKNLAFVDAVARKKVELTMAQISEKSPVLKELQSSHALLVTGAMYNIETAAVEFFS
jgi:carbonic anhydrase